jgi:hypothetical protein
MSPNGPLRLPFQANAGGITRKLLNDFLLWKNVELSSAHIDGNYVKRLRRTNESQKPI